MKKARKLLAFGDVHFPQENSESVAIMLAAIRQVKPDLVVSLGDVLDCGQFSSHPPTRGVPETAYEADIEQANKMLDDIQKHAGRLVMVEGNHEYRLDRWAAKTTEGRGAYSMLSPRLNLSRGRKAFTYIPYGTAGGRYPHYKINSRLVAVHGWSYAKHATKNHLSLSQGMSVIHGHTHRCDTSIVQNVWKSGASIQARSAGCMCKQIPMYGTGSPVEWVNAFVLGYLGSHSDTLYTIPIVSGRCILPDGKEIRA
jgi:predicted phosphodiesterase